MNIGKRIKEKRLAAQMTLEELSSKVGLSRQTLSRYETGVIANIPSDKIELIAQTLDTTPAYLMGWEEKAIRISEKGHLGGMFFFDSYATILSIFDGLDEKKRLNLIEHAKKFLSLTPPNQKAADIMITSLLKAQKREAQYK